MSFILFYNLCFLFNFYISLFRMISSCERFFDMGVFSYFIKFEIFEEEWKFTFTSEKEATRFEHALVPIL